MVKKHILDVSPTLWKQVQLFKLQNDLNDINSACVELITRGLQMSRVYDQMTTNNAGRPRGVQPPATVSLPLQDAEIRDHDSSSNSNITPITTTTNSKRREQWSSDYVKKLEEERKRKFGDSDESASTAPTPVAGGFIVKCIEGCGQLNKSGPVDRDTAKVMAKVHKKDAPYHSSQIFSAASGTLEESLTAA